MNFPNELKYTQDHEWVRLEGNIATIGITEFAQRELGDIVYLDVNKNQGELAAHAIFGAVEAVKTVSDLFMPVSGEISEVNPALNSAPELINSDPYGEGWMIKIAVSNAAEVDGLLTADAYKALIGA